MENALDIENLTDIELLDRLQRTQDDAAYSEFVRRYYDDVKRECLLICKKRKLDKHIGVEIAHKTFERVKRTKSFNKKKLSNISPREAILGWLYRIESNLFIDYHRSLKSKDQKNESYLEELFNEIEIPPDQDLSFKRDKAQEIMKRLTEKQRIVIIADFEHKRFQRYHDSDVLESLAIGLGVKKNSIRKIRERAKNKIMELIDEINGKK